MPMEFKKSSKDRDLLILDGYVFHKNKSYDGKDYWRCSCYKSKRCRSCAVTNGTKLLSHTPHNHEGSVDKDQYIGNVSQVGVDSSKINNHIEDKPPTTEKTFVSQAHSLPNDMINQSILESRSDFIRNNIKQKSMDLKDEPVVLLHNEPNIKKQFKDQPNIEVQFKDQDSISRNSMKDQDIAASSSMDYEDFHIDLISGSNRTSSPIQKSFIKRKRSRSNVENPKIYHDDSFKSDEIKEIEKPFKSKKLRKLNDENYLCYANDLSKSDESDELYNSKDDTIRDEESHCESNESEDPNLLVNRLRVLMKGLQMGNLKNYAEIHEILSQLRESGYIS